MGSTSFVSFLGPLLVAWITAVGADSPCGCVATQSLRFGLAVDKLSAQSPYKREINSFAVSLNNGILIDSQGRTGYIASNEQFQYDGPPQAGAKFVSGFSLCSNGSLALGSTTVWYQCLSGNFYNLYDANIDPGACSQVAIKAINVDTGALLLPSSANGASCSATAGGPKVTAVQPISQISDGQPQASIGVKPISQISDGQIQAPTAIISQISDGQIQAPTAAPASANPVTSSPASGIPVPASSGAGTVSVPPGTPASGPAPGYTPSSQIPASPAVVGGGGSAAPVAATGAATAAAPNTVIPPAASSTSSLRFNTVPVSASSVSVASSSVSNASPTAPSSNPSATKASGAGSFAVGSHGSHALVAAAIAVFAWAWGI